MLIVAAMGAVLLCVSLLLDRHTIAQVWLSLAGLLIGLSLVFLAPAVVRILWEQRR
jgi:hypothetical protein